MPIFVGIQDKPVSGVGCRSPPAHLDFSKIQGLEVKKMSFNSDRRYSKLVRVCTVMEVFDL